MAKSLLIPNADQARRSRSLREIDLVRDALARIRKHSRILACQDVPILGRCVDLVYLDQGRITTVEFKLHDWRRGVRQARDHLLAADHAYVCVPERRISSDMRALLMREQVGLAFFSKRGAWPFLVEVEAPLSRETWGMAKLWLQEYVVAHNNTAISRPR